MMYPLENKSFLYLNIFFFNYAVLPFSIHRLPLIEYFRSRSRRSRRGPDLLHCGDHGTGRDQKHKTSRQESQTETTDSDGFVVETRNLEPGHRSRFANVEALVHDRSREQRANLPGPPVHQEQRPQREDLLEVYEMARRVQRARHHQRAQPGRVHAEEHAQPRAVDDLFDG